MPAPLELRDLFAEPWTGEAVVWRPSWLRWFPGPDRFHFRSEIRDVTPDSWQVVDTTTLPSGQSTVRTMRSDRIGEGRYRLAAADMPGGAEVTTRHDGFDFSPYVIRTPVLGPLRLPLRYRNGVRIAEDGTMVDEIELRFLGVLVGRVTMRLRRAGGLRLTGTAGS